VTGGVLLLLMASISVLVRYTRRSQELAELKMDFVAGVSHELRTPLTVIHTAAYNLRGRLAQDPARVEKYGALIQHESGRLTQLVEQVLQFAGAEAGRIIQDREPVEMAAVLGQALESARSLTEASRCTVERIIPEGLPAVLGDAAALKRAFENLLANAARHGCGEDRWIGLSAAKATEGSQQWIEVRVADHGPGIPSGEIKHVFDPFFRGRRAVQDQVHGSGLGLNLVRKIVEAHGGSVRAESDPGRLTEFVVRIPAMPVEQTDEFKDTAGRG
jgi:signal transduction histidine kinase